MVILLNIISKLRILVLPSLIGITILSCNNDRENACNIIKEWANREIVFPQTLEYRIIDKQIDFNILGSDYKIVTFLDSTDCIPCNLRLKDWKSLIGDFDRLPDVDVDFIMVLNGSDWERNTELLKKTSFPFVVAKDINSLFKKTNMISNDSDYHTFLLDMENHVVAIGNPIRNPKIRSLYKEIIQSSSQTINDSEHEGKYTIASHAFGTVSPDSCVSVSFKYVNKTNKELNLQDIIPSCECVQSFISTNKLLPDSIADIIVFYSADSIQGHFRRYVDIFFNETINPVRLKVHGYISQNNNN